MTASRPCVSPPRHPRSPTNHGGGAHGPVETAPLQQRDTLTRLHVGSVVLRILIWGTPPGTWRGQEGIARLALWSHHLYVLTSIVQKRLFSAVLALLGTSVSSPRGAPGAAGQAQGRGSARGQTSQSRGPGYPSGLRGAAHTAHPQTK